MPILAVPARAALPGAVNLPNGQLAPGGAAAPGDQVDMLLANLGLGPTTPAAAAPTITYCNTGHWASVA